MHLTILDGQFAVARLPAGSAAPAWASGEIVSVTRTPEETSIVCEETAVPDSVPAERGWRCLKVEGPLDFELTGVLAGLTRPLANAGVSVFALSTYDTDYLLVKAEQVTVARAALEDSGEVVG